MFFEDFFGGHPGMHGMGGPREEVDTDKLYGVLGVEKNATQREIKKKWRSLCKKHHPDRGGDPEKFKELEEAYHVLSDQDKRNLYDEGGMEAVRSGHVSTNIFDLFGGGRRQQSGPKKPAPIKQLLEITLEDVVSGATTKYVKVTVMSADERNQCPACKGRGMVMETLRRGHMILQQQRKCSKCDGKGISFVNEQKIEKRLEVLIPPGVKDGDHYPLDGEGHDLPGLPTGDVVIIFKIKAHPLYKRKGADLAMIKELTLREALCGYSFHVKSIVKGNWLLVKSQEGSVVQHGDVIKIEEHGLPQKGKRGAVKGDLYIRFHVVLPDSGSLSASDLTVLTSILSPDKVQYTMPGGGVIDTREITVGSAVRLIGLQNRPDLNGVEGEVIQANIRPGQYAVQLVTGQTVAVRAELLELTEAVSPTDVIEETPAEGEYVEEVNGHKVEDMERVRHTPAQMGNIHDDDEMEDEEVSCRQM